MSNNDNERQFREQLHRAAEALEVPDGLEQRVRDRAQQHHARPHDVRGHSRWLMPALIAAAVVAAAVLLVVTPRSDVQPAGPNSAEVHSSDLASGTSGMTSPNAETVWWSRPGPYVTDKAALIECGKLTPNWTVLEPDDARPEFDVPSDGVGVTASMQNKSGSTLEGFANVAILVYLDPSTNKIVGFGGNSLMTPAFHNVAQGETFGVYFLNPARDCRETPSKPLPDGEYHAFLKVRSEGPKGAYLIPVSADVSGRKAIVAAPSSAVTVSSFESQQIAGRTWTLRELVPAEGATVVVADLKERGVQPNLELDVDGSFNLLTGLNGNTGTYTIAGSSLTFDLNVVSSSLLVENGSDEAKIASAMGNLLEGATIVDTAGDRLVLRTTNEDELIFE